MLASFIETTPFVFVGLAALLGLVVGSFLNVVIVRLPAMQFRSWRQDALDFLKEQAPETLNPTPIPHAAEETPYNLHRPASQCPHCHHRIRFYDNIPLLSFFWLRGRCRDCSAPIHWRYPLVEGLTSLLSAWAAFHFGVGWQACAALVLTWVLIAQTFIDLEHQLLLDDLTLPMLWLGLLLSLVPVFADPQSSVLGAALGYLLFWFLYWSFKLLTDKEAMGYGDFKLLAMLGAWLGWQALLTIILISSLLGSLIGIGLIVFRGRDRNLPIPFGPYLAIAGWAALNWNREIVDVWLNWL